MAAGDSKLTICNDALLMLGATEMTSFTEGTDSAKICDRLYDDLKKYILSIYPWSFAKVKVQLAKTSDTPVTEWKNVYALPADIVGTPKAVFITSTAGARPETEFELYGESSIIYPPLKLNLSARISAPNLYVLTSLSLVDIC